MENETSRSMGQSTGSAGRLEDDLVVLVGHAAVRVDTEDAHELDDIKLTAGIDVGKIPKPRMFSLWEEALD